MFVRVVSSNEDVRASIGLVTDADYKAINRKRHFFIWKLEKARIVYKLTAEDGSDILGLMSLAYFDDEQRIEIILIAVSVDNMGAGKRYDRIAGNLIAFAARLAFKEYGATAAISLVPKTGIVQHYMTKYGFSYGGRSLYMDGKQLMKILKDYDYD